MGNASLDGNFPFVPSLPIVPIVSTLLKFSKLTR